MKTLTSLIALSLIGGAAFFAISAKPQELMPTSNEKPVQPTKKVVKTDAEWKKQLTSEQYRIARKGGTESPDGAVYKQFKKQGNGDYYCIGCGAKLFSSSTKFDSRSGWPSFYDRTENVKTVPDPDGFRIEVKCAVCDAHLGHVFKGEGLSLIHI